MSRTPEDSEGEQVANWDRVSALELGEEGFRNGKYGSHLMAKNPHCAARLIGKQIYQYALAIIREYENDTDGRKINSRKTVGEECETGLGGMGETGNRSQ